MEASKAAENQQEGILYDLLQPAEWTLDPELPAKSTSRQFPWNLALSARDAGSTLWSLASSPFRWPSHTTTLQQVVAQKLPWKLAISPDGLFLAILQDRHVEIRRCVDRDEDTSVLIARFDVHADSQPHWRRICWDASSSFVACSFSWGEVCVYDKFGQAVADLSKHVVRSGTEGPHFAIERAVCGLLFAPCTSAMNGLTQVLVVTFGGQLYNYLVKGGRESSLQYRFDFSAHSIELVSAVTYSPSKNLLLVAACTQTKSHEKKSSSASASSGMVQVSVLAWRLLDSEPHCARSVVSGDLGSSPTSQDMLTTVRRIRLFAGSAGANVEKAVITHMALSPDGSTLATVDCGGTLQLRDVPSLRVTHTYSYAEQFPEDPAKLSLPSFAVKKKKKEFSSIMNVFSDISWWSEEAVILACDRGDVVVSSFQNKESLHNRLGVPEVLEPYPALASVAGAGGFYALECDRQLVSQDRPRRADSRDVAEPVSSDEGDGGAARKPREEDGDDDDDEEEEDDEDTPLLRRLTRRSATAGKQMLYYLTENDRFRTEPKRPKVPQFTYRLFSLQSRTPEELFYRRITAEEYGEALRLAQCYGLDKDLVYQSQWNASSASPHTIQDYLAKISKHSWVLSECLQRIPDRYDTLMDLLNYGLLRTQSSAVLQLSAIPGVEQGTSDAASGADAADWAGSIGGGAEVDQFGNPVFETPVERQLREEKIWDERAKKLRFAALSEEQQMMVKSRVQLLQYKDRLVTYESVLGRDRVDEDYSVEFFRKFRDANLVQSALQFAQAAEWKSVDALFCLHGDETLPHRLAILSHFPETMDPKEYKYLLPELSERGDVVEFIGEDQRPRDWAEELLERTYGAHTDAGEFLYTDTPSLAAFRGKLTSPVVTHWYKQRAVQIESLAGLVENSLKLITLGTERNVKGLDGLHADLLTLETLVYECGHDVTLKRLLSMPLSEQLELILSRAQSDDSAMFVRDVRCWAMPLLKNAEKRGGRASGADLLADYLLKRAKDDLRLPLAVFEASVGSKPIIDDKANLVRIALSCIYACESEDQLSLSDAIVRCLPSSKSSTAKQHRDLLQQVDKLEEHLAAAEVICSYDVKVSIRTINNVQSDAAEVEKVLMKLARHVARRSCMEYSEFRALIDDILDLQCGVFSAVTEHRCYEIVARALLASGKQAHLVLADGLLSGSDQPMVTTIRPASATGVGGGRTSSSSGSPSLNSLRRRSSSLQPIAYRIPFDRSLTLVVDSAREYFNSAASLDDPDMILACECLDLIKVESPAIQAELNLVNAVKLLNDFSVPILPLQVRLHEDRLSLVKSCIAASPTSYKDSDKLLSLGMLLTSGAEAVSPTSSMSQLNDEHTGIILMWIADKALQVDDTSFASETLTKLMDVSHGPAWKLCRTLGLCEAAGDLTFRRRLLSFAITHCPSDAMEQLLENIHLLEAKFLCYEATEHSSSIVRTGTAVVQSVVMRSADAVQSVMDSSTVSRVMDSASAVTSFVSMGAGTVTQMVGAGDLGSGVSDSRVGKSAGEIMDNCRGWMQTASSYWPSSLTTAQTSDATSSAPGTSENNAPMARGSVDGNGEHPTGVLMQAHCHQFYTDVFARGSVSDDCFSYSHLFQERSQLSQQISLKQGLLRTCRIVEQQNRTPVDEAEITQVLLQLAEDCLLTDTSLALSYLLTLPKVDSANVLFDRLPSCLLTYQLAIFYYCLHVYARCEVIVNSSSAGKDTSQADNKKPDKAAAAGGKSKKAQRAAKQAPAQTSSSALPLLNRAYSSSPGEIVQWVLDKSGQVGEKTDSGDLNCADLERMRTEVDDLAGGLRIYRDRLADFVQAGILRELDDGIDATRFTTDTSYKREVILSLSRRLDTQSVSTALSLSRRYDLGEWPVYMEHAIFLFNNSQLSWNDIHERLTGERLPSRDNGAATASIGGDTSSNRGTAVVEILLSDAQKFADRLRSDIFPNLDGCDHARLLLYYDLLQQCVGRGATDEKPISAVQHSKSLKKLKAAVPGLDYKQLVYGSSPLDAIRPVVMASNVHVIAKMVAKLPVADGFLSASRVFAAFCIKLFWDGEGKKKTAESSMDWVHRYEAAQEYASKLSAADLLQFCQSMMYSQQAYELVQVEARLEICRRCTKLCRQLANPSQPGQLKKRGSTVGSSAAATTDAEGETSYEEAVRYLQRCLSHLDSLQNSAISELKDIDTHSSTDYHRRYSTTPAQPEQVVSLCTDLITSSGCSLRLVDDILALASTVCPHGTHLSRMVRDLISQALDSIGNGEDEFSRLSSSLSSVSTYLESGGQSLRSSDIVELLRAFCAQSDIQMSSRLSVLRLLQQSFHLSEEDEALLLFCNTAATVKQIFELEIKASEVADSAKRLELFERLLSLCEENPSSLTGVAELINMWPPLPACTDGRSAWSVLFLRMLSSTDSSKEDNSSSS
eukprot:scpid5108/ scgid19701/ Neuroblastoma-amplified sequence; Neuroblastoma-amplified gene protein homolog